MSNIFPVTDGVVLSLNIAIQVTLITLAALLTSVALKRSAALRGGVLTLALILVLLAPLTSALCQVTGANLLSVQSNDSTPVSTDSHWPGSTPLEIDAIPLIEPVESFDDFPSMTSIPAANPIEITTADTVDLATQQPQLAVPAETAPSVAPADSVNTQDVLTWALIVWCVGFTVALSRVAIGILRLRRLLSEAVPLSDRHIERQLLSVPGHVDLLQSNEVSSPVTCGWWRHRIVLPSGLCDRLSDDELHLVLTHELAHVARRDPLILLLQHLAACVYWPHPLVWIMNRQLAQAREEACDNAVLQQTDAPTYGRTLLAVAELLPSRRSMIGAVCLMNAKWKLESRVSGLLDARRNTSPGISRSGRSLIGVVTLAALAMIVSTTIGIAQSEPENRSVSEPPSAAEIPGTQQPETQNREPAGTNSQPTTDSTSTTAKIEDAKTRFRKSRNDAQARLAALKVLYPIIQPGMSRLDVLNLLGSPDPAPARGNFARFLNYVIAPQQWVEIEFDRDQKLVVRKVAHGLNLDPAEEAIPPILESQRDWLADYRAATDDPKKPTTLRAGFIPYKPELVDGEPLTVTMTVANIGDSDFRFSFGGDYRGSGRHNRIKVVVTDADGEELVDPRANAPDFGGISSFEIVTPRGLNYTHTFDLATFRTIPGPGRYTVTCSFAFDEPYTNTDTPRPVIKSTFPLTILERTPERVSAVLDELQLRVDRTPPEALPAAMASIATFGRTDALPRLGAYLESGSLPHQTAAFSALPLVPGETSLRMAVAGLTVDSSALQSAAAQALGRFPDAAGVDALLTALSKVKTPSPVQETLLQALGTTKSDRAMAALTESLEAESLAIRVAAVAGLARMGGADAVTALRKHVDSDDLAFRFRVVKALAEKLRVPIDPDWLAPVLMCRRHNSREWLDSLSVLRIWCGEDALPVLLSVVDWDRPWSHRNFWILHHAKYAKGAPEFDYIYDPNSQGTVEQHAANRQLFERLKPLAAPRPEQTFWPEPQIMELQTDPPIDFSVQLSTLKGSGEQPATVTCGFLKETWNRNGGSSSFRPTGPHAATYQVAKTVRAILKSEDSIRESGLSDAQIADLKQLTIPLESPTVPEGLSLLYIWWQESPNGPIRGRANRRLCNAVRRAVQQHHLDHLAFAEAARNIMEPPVQQPVQLQQERAFQLFEIQRIHPSMRASKVWLDLKERLASSAVKYRWVEVDEDGSCRLSLQSTPTSDLSHLKGVPLKYLDLHHTHVRDLSPLEGMPLERLDLSGTKVESLEPLRGMPLTAIDLSSTNLRDLRPLAGAPLISFIATGNPIDDLSPLKGAPLRYVELRRTQVSDISAIINSELDSIQIEDSPVSDLSPLRGLKLYSLWLGRLGDFDLQQLRGLTFERLTLKGDHYTDIEALQGLIFEDLWLDGTQVRDLSPLKDSRLTGIGITGAPIDDISPLKDLKLTELYINAADGLDLAPLAGMPLRHVGLRSIWRARNVEVLRDIETMKDIRSEGKPHSVDEFWKLYDAGAFSKPE